MKRLRTFTICCVMIATSTCFAQKKADASDPPKKDWKIMRDKSTNDCIAMKITAMHPGYTDQLGTYETEQQAKDALEKFKKMDDPNKSGFEMCTNQ